METDQPAQPVVLQLAQSIVDQIDGAVHASVATPSGDMLVILVSTDDHIDSVGQPCDGPIVAAWRTGRVTRIPTVQRCTEFPRFVERCRRLGISSAAAFPIKNSARCTTGVLTVTSLDYHGFGTSDIKAARSVADRLAVELDRPLDLSVAHGRAADAD